MPLQPIIRKIKDSEIIEAVKFHNDYFKSKRTTKHWDWEYKSLHPELSVFVIAKTDESIVGTQGMIPIYLNINGEKYLTGKSENSLVDSKFQGILFFKLYSFAIKMSKELGMNCIWGYTGETDVWRKGLKFKVNDHIMYESVLIVNPLNAFAEISHKKWSSIKKTFFSCLSFIIYFWSRWRICFLSFSSKNYVHNSFEIRTELKSNQDIIKLFENLRNKCENLIHLEMDETYLKWRVFNNPSIKYQTFFLYNDLELQALCFLNKNQNNSVYISEFSFLNDNAGKFLLEHCLKTIKKGKVGLIYFFGNKNNPIMKKTFRLLEKYGFVSRNSKTALVIKNLKLNNDETIYRSENWYAGGLMTEGYMI